MTTLLGYLPTSQRPALARQLSEHLTDDEVKDLTRLSEDALRLLAPLAQATSRGRLDILLTHTLPRYLHLLKELGQRIWPAFSDGVDVERIIADLYAHIRSEAELKRDLFGDEAFEQYFGSLDSAEAFLSWTIRTERKLEKRPDRALLGRYEALTQSVLSPVLQANMSISAIQLIVLDIIDEWLVDSIPVLTSAADDFMTLVEDEFISFEMLSESDVETVEFEAVRRELGL